MVSTIPILISAGVKGDHHSGQYDITDSWAVYSRYRKIDNSLVYIMFIIGTMKIEKNIMNSPVIFGLDI
ncbi:MAG: hypothetical protein ABFD08_09420 [Syntrophomonas sp.]